MKTILRRLWNDQGGALLSAEYLLLATLLGIGLIVGIKSVRDSVVRELHQLAVAIGRLDCGPPWGGGGPGGGGGGPPWGGGGNGPPWGGGGNGPPWGNGGGNGPGGDFQVAADAFSE